MSRIRIKILAVLVLLGAIGAQSETVVWSDNFDSTAINWTTNTVWKIGSPASGPSTNSAGDRSYSGTRCATTALKGNAPSSVDSRLVCTNYDGLPYLTVPAASTFPRLRFWQWFYFVNALGFVEVREQSGTNWLAWQTISATNLSVGGTSSVGGGWTRPSLDLGGFAGLNIQIAFHFSSGINVGSDPGWYLDDVALVTDAPVFNNPEKFTGGLGDWYVDKGTWQAGKPVTGTNAAYPPGTTNCAGTMLTGYYPVNADTRLISPPFMVPATNNPALHFWQWYKFINALGFVEVSSAVVQTNFTYSTNFLTATNINNDTNVITVTNVNFAFFVQTNLATFTNINTDTFIYYLTNAGSLQTNTLSFTNINTGSNVFTNTDTVDPFYLQTNIYIFTNLNQFGTYITTNFALATNVWQSISQTNISSGSGTTSSGGWVGSSLDLSPFAGQTLQVAFHFISAANLGNAPGWYVDDISVVTSPILTVPASRTITKGQTFTDTATATNSSAPGMVYSFSFARSSTNAFITTNGVVGWTNKIPILGTNILSVVVVDTNSPPVRVTNSFTVDVWPTNQFSISNAPAGKKFFLIALHSQTNTTWQIQASTNLTDWLPVWTNSTKTSGTLMYTDLLATNFPDRFYRGVYPY